MSGSLNRHDSARGVAARSFGPLPVPRAARAGGALLRALLSLGVIACTAAPASALPIFARRYQTSCTSCHVVVPKLNAFGIAFRNNGYRIPLNDEKFIKIPDVPLGAPGWKKLWPDSVWPGAIPGMPPLAVRVGADVNIRPSDPVNSLNFNFPSGLNLYFAGSEGAGISFFGTVFVSGPTNAVSIDRAYAQFRLTPDTPGQNPLVLKVGRIETRAEPFSSTYRKTTSQPFNVSDLRLAAGGFGLRDHDAGIELWGAVTGPHDRGGLEYAAGVMQGTAGRPENNNAKDYYGAVSYKFFGFGVVGSRGDDDSSTFDNRQGEQSVTVGAFSYSGRGQPTSAGVTGDRFTRTGMKVDAWLGKLNVYGAFANGEDQLLGVSPATITANAVMAEADYLWLPWVMPTLRVERTTYSDRPDVILVLPAVSLLLRANVRVNAEAHLFNDVRAADGTRINPNEGLVQLAFVF